MCQVHPLSIPFHHCAPTFFFHIQQLGSISAREQHPAFVTGFEPANFARSGEQSAEASLIQRRVEIFSRIKFLVPESKPFDTSATGLRWLVRASCKILGEMSRVLVHACSGWICRPFQVLGTMHTEGMILQVRNISMTLLPAEDAVATHAFYVILHNPNFGQLSSTSQKL